MIKGKFSIDPELTISWLRYMVENSKTIEQKKDVKYPRKAAIPERDLREGELECLAALLQTYEKEFETSSTDTKAILNADAQTKYRASSGVAQLAADLISMDALVHEAPTNASHKKWKRQAIDIDTRMMKRPATSSVQQPTGCFSLDHQCTSTASVRL